MNTKRQILINKREELSLSRKQVANILGISEIFVRKIEEGRSNPGRVTMLKFEQFYETSIRDLFPELFSVPSDTKRIKKLKEKVI